MNNNTNLITHIQTDPNAWKHSAIGSGVCIATAIGAYAANAGAYSLLYGFSMALLAGISIEIVQRIQGGTNTNRESVMDALTTMLWFLYPVAKKP